MNSSSHPLSVIGRVKQRNAFSFGIYLENQNLMTNCGETAERQVQCGHYHSACVEVGAAVVLEEWAQECARLARARDGWEMCVHAIEKGLEGTTAKVDAGLTILTQGCTMHVQGCSRTHCM